MNKILFAACCTILAGCAIDPSEWLTYGGDQGAAEPERALRIHVTDDRLLPAFWEARDMLEQETGLALELGTPESGVPMGIERDLTWKGKRIDGLAYFNVECVFDECNDHRYGAWIAIDSELLASKGWALEWSVKHEIVHVVSGWGIPAGDEDGHLSDDAKHLMSPGCRNHVCPGFTAEDYELVCSGAPCR